MSLISVSFLDHKDRLRVAARALSGDLEDDFHYHQRRAEDELSIAQAAESPVARRFHYHLAALHLDRAHAEAANAAPRVSRVA